MPDLRDLGFVRAERTEGTRPMLEHGIIASAPVDVNTPVGVILPEFANDQIWGPYRWQHNGSDMPQAGDDCLIAFSNRREGWVLAYWSGVYVPPAGGGGSGVTSWNTRAGAVVPASGDYTVAQVTGAAPLASPAFTGTPTAPTPSFVDNSTAIATTAYVRAQGYLTTAPVTSVFSRTGAVVATTGDYTVAQVTGAAPLASPTFTGSPTAPTPAVGDNSTAIATTAFVKSQGYLSSGVATFNGRSGTVLPATGDYTVAQVTGAAPLASPALTGTPTAPTPATADNSTTLATTAFVKAQGYVTSATAPVTSVFTRTGAVVAATGDYTVAQVTGAAPLASPTFTGTPAAPTAAVDTNTTQLATTAFVLGQLSAAGDGTPAMDGTAGRGTSTHFARADHIHPTDTTRAPLASPALTGSPTAPTAATADNSTTIATTAFVKAQGYVTAASAPVTSVFSRTGAVVAANGDYYGVVAAALTGATSNSRYVGATISGAPTSGTFSTGDWVIAQNGHHFICTAGGTPGTWVDTGSVGNVVTSVFSRTGAVVATTGDYTVAQITGAAPLASPTFTGTPAAPTPATGDNSTTIATTAFVKAQGYLTSAPVSSVFTRTGAVVAANGDYMGVVAAALTGATAATRYVGGTTSGAPTSGTFAVGDHVVAQNGHLWICTAAGTPGTWADAGAAATAGVTSFNGRNGVVVPASGDYTVAQVTGAAPLASPTFTGTPLAPTPAAGTNTTQIATTAFVASSMANSASVTISAVNTDLAWPWSIQAITLAEISTGGGSLRSIGAPPVGTGQLICLFNTVATPVTILDYTTGGTGHPMVLNDRTSFALQQWESIVFMYDGSNWAEVARHVASPTVTTPAGGPATAADSSTKVPNTQWVLQNAVPPGTTVPYAGDNAPAGWLLCNNQAVSRTTYANLFNVLVTSKGTVTVTIATPAVFTTGAAHNLVVGDTVFFEPVGGTLPTGLSADVAYVVTAVPTTTTFRISATISIVAGVSTPGADLNTTAAGTATSINLFRAPYAEIGGTAFSATTFNVPGLQGDTIFAFKSGDAYFGAMGIEAGESTHTLAAGELAAHTHADTATFTGSAMGTHQHADTAAFTGSAVTSSSVSGGTPAGSVSSSFSGSGLAAHSHEGTNQAHDMSWGSSFTRSGTGIGVSNIAGITTTTDTTYGSWTTAAVGAGTPAGSVSSSFTGSALAGHTHSVTAAGTVAITPNAVSAGTPAGTVAITAVNNSPAGGAHNNTSPYMVMNYIIKT